MDRKQMRLARRAKQASEARIRLEVREDLRRLRASIKARGLTGADARREMFRSVFMAVPPCPLVEAFPFNNGGEYVEGRRDSPACAPVVWPDGIWKTTDDIGKPLAEPIVFRAFTSHTVLVPANASPRRMRSAVRRAVETVLLGARLGSVALLMPSARVTAKRNQHGLVEVRAFALTTPVGVQ